MSRESTYLQGLSAQIRANLEARGLTITEAVTHAQELALIRTPPPPGLTARQIIARINALGVAAYLAEQNRGAR